MYWVEVRASQQRRGRPYLVPLSEVSKVSGGFRSVYAYDDATRDLILAQSSTAGLVSTPVYSDVLLVDFDNCEPDDLLYHCYDNSLAHEVYESGNRSWHVHIPLVPAYGADVPWSQKQWVQEHAPLADVTYYHQAGQFRLDGTRHEKTGRYKRSVRKVEGQLLDIPIVARQPASLRGGGQAGLFFAHLLRPAVEGGRRVYVWHLAKLAHSEGLSYEVAVARVLWWNQNFCRPILGDTVVKEKVHDVYYNRQSTLR